MPLTKQRPREIKRRKVELDSHTELDYPLLTIQYNFIAKCQYTDCTRNVLWSQVHSSHIHSNHKTFNYNNSNNNNNNKKVFYRM